VIVHSKEPSWCILSFEPLECPAVCSLTRMVHLPPCLPFHHTCEDEEDFFVARRLASLPHSGIFFRRAILLQANCFLLVYVAISWRAQERTSASGPNRSPVRQRSNALKRLPTSLTIVYHLLYCTDPPTGVQTNTAITTVISAAVRTYTARPSRLCGWSRWSMLTRWSCLWSRS
jgi:hypothetical protein